MSSQFDDDIPPAEIVREGWILVRINVPELDIFKCLQFPVDKLIWDIKQQVLASLPKVSSPFFINFIFIYKRLHTNISMCVHVRLGLESHSCLK